MTFCVQNLQIDGTSMTLYAFLILIIIVVYRVLFYFAIALKKK